MARSESSRRVRLALVAPVALAFASASELPQPFVFVAGVEGAGHHGIVHALVSAFLSATKRAQSTMSLMVPSRDNAGAASIRKASH